jgi:hypothetical protein
VLGFGEVNRLPQRLVRITGAVNRDQDVPKHHALLPSRRALCDRRAPEFEYDEAGAGRAEMVEAVVADPPIAAAMYSVRPTV